MAHWELGPCLLSSHTGRHALCPGGGGVAQWLRTQALESMVLRDPGRLFNLCCLRFLFSKMGIMMVPSKVNTKRQKSHRHFKLYLR